MEFELNLETIDKDYIDNDYSYLTLIIKIQSH